MNIVFLVIFLLFTSMIAAQDTTVEAMVSKGNIFYEQGDFQQARTYYVKAHELDPEDSDALFNLAATEMNLGQKERACELFHKAYLNGDYGAYNPIMEHCEEHIILDRVSILHLEEFPKFEYRGEYLPLVVDKRSINPKYVKLLTREVRKSEPLKQIQNRLHIKLNVDINGELMVKIGNTISEKNKERLIDLMRGMTTYQPARYKGRNVELIGGFAWPLNID